MHLVSVNVGLARPIRNAGKSGETGIFKEPEPGRVAITTSGVQRDVISDRENHGGPDQAVYVYGTPDYEWWSEALDRELLPGTFGENLTVAGLQSARLIIGDCLHAGSAVLEVTAPRIPCATLAARMEDPAFLKRFRKAERPGVYCRVLEGGYVEAGEAVSVEPYRGSSVSVLEMFRDFFDPRPTEEKLRRYLDAPIAVRARIDKERQLRALVAGGTLRTFRCPGGYDGGR